MKTLGFGSEKKTTKPVAEPEPSQESEIEKAADKGAEIVDNQLEE